MRTFRLFAVSLLLMLSMALSNVAHAAELIESPSASLATSLPHLDGSADRSGGDEGKGASHHHAGCHGHHIAMEAAHSSMTPARRLLSAFAPLAPSAPPASVEPRPLRPPIA